MFSTGNADDRRRFAEVLGSGHLDADGRDRAVAAIDAPDGERAAVSICNGLRLVTLDMLVPGKAHGWSGEAQLRWLRGILAEPAVKGTVLAFHHPPILHPNTVRLRPTGSINAGGSRVELTAGGHKGEPEQIRAPPLRRLGRARVVGSQSDTPGPVYRTRLHQHPLPRAQQVGPQARVLVELRQVATHDDAEPLLVPAFLVKSSHRATEPLGFTGMTRSTYRFGAFVVAEQPCLVRHHVVLRGCEAAAVLDEH
nr:hypothetical protein [Glycomyces salinus]